MSEIYEPYGEFGDMIDLLNCFTQLLKNNLARFVSGKQKARHKDGRKKGE